MRRAHTLTGDADGAHASPLARPRRRSSSPVAVTTHSTLGTLRAATRASRASSRRHNRHAKINVWVQWHGREGIQFKPNLCYRSVVRVELIVGIELMLRALEREAMNLVPNLLLI